MTREWSIDLNTPSDHRSTTRESSEHDSIHNSTCQVSMASTPEVSDHRDGDISTTAGDVIYIASNINLNISAHHKISHHLDLGLRVCSGRSGLSGLFRSTLSPCGSRRLLPQPLRLFRTTSTRSINFYILALITTLKVINMDLIVSLNADSFKHYVVYVLILKLIFSRI